MNNLARVESLFIEKLTEKYRLTERDLKKAFAKYDIDHSGHLTVEELTNVINLFLNGVDRSIVSKLVEQYDVDHDGSISIEEFCQFILSRSSPDKSKWLTVNYLTDNNTVLQHQKQTVPDEDSEAIRYEGEKDLAYRAKMYLQNLKALLTKQALNMRNARTLSKPEKFSNTSTLIESIGRATIKKEFSSYLNQTHYGPRCEFDSFKRSKFQKKFLKCDLEF